MIARCDHPIRVMHVLHSLCAGGAERIVCDLQRRRGSDLRQAIVCLDRLGPLADEARSLGMDVYCTDRREGLDGRQVWRIAGLIRRIRPDVIHAHQYTPYFYAAMSASACGFGPILFTEHGRHWPDVVSPARRAVNQLLRLRRDRVTAVCHFVADALRRNERIAGRGIRVIPNGVWCEEYVRPRRREWLAGLLGARPQDPVLIQVARLHGVKDHMTSLRAFRQVRAVHRNARLVLVGDGPDESRVIAAANELGIRQAVHMLGLRRDVPDLLAAADVFVLSSLCEAASLSILEAMSAGLPVAATNVGGNAEIVLDGRTGLLSPRGDAAALAANIIALLGDPVRCRSFGQAGRERAQDLFHQRRMHDEFVKLYRQLSEDAA
jgi:glycosyltransferase involved in cell wall biosynthesis